MLCVPNEQQSRAIIDYFQKFNLSFLNTRNWDAARVALRDVLGHSPRTGLPMLTREEALAIAVNEIDFDNTNNRREFAKRTRDILETSEAEYRQQQDASAESRRVDEVERRANVLSAAKIVDGILSDMLVADATKVRRRVMQSAQYTQAQKQGLDGGEAYRVERAAYYQENYN